MVPLAVWAEPPAATSSARAIARTAFLRDINESFETITTLGSMSVSAYTSEPIGGRRGQQATKYWDLNRRGYYIERSGGLTAASKNGPYVETELGVAPRPRHLYRDDAALSFPLGLPEDGIGWLHQPFPPARHHLGHHRVEDDLTLEVQSLRPQRVPAGEFDLGAWNRECEVWQRDATVGESEAAAEIGDDVFAPGIVGVA